MDTMDHNNLERQWDPSQYLKYASLRLRPALDLLNRIALKDPQRIYDLGCGAGNVTRIIAERWPNAQVVGFDHSPDMLAKASQEKSSITWQEGDVGLWRVSEPVSNATLHWLPDHQTLFPHLLEQLSPDGILAVQMPMSGSITSHSLMREVIASGTDQGGAFGDEKLRQEMSRPTVCQPQEYYEILAPRLKELEIWTTEYFQILEGKEAVFEWVKATGLRPVLNGLDQTEQKLFLAEYRQRLLQVD